MRKDGCACALLAVLSAAPATAQEKDEEPAFEVYGFAQVDYIQDFKRVNPAWDDTLRPSRIPTDEGTFGDGGQAVIGVRQSRFGVTGRFGPESDRIFTKFEFDMFGVGPDEGQTTIRLRHAYGEWGSLLGGQTHSLFMDIDLFPNVLDYWGPSGMVFLRTPQIRWQPVRGDTYFAVAIEHATGDIDPGQLREIDPALGDAVANDELLPDFTAQVRWNGDWGHLQLSGIARLLGYETLGTPDNEPSERTMGWGVNLGTNLKFGERDRLILGAVYGRGIASYMNDGGTDLGPEGELGDLSPKAVPLLGVVGYFDHYWSEAWSTSLGYSRTQVWNTDFQSDDAFQIGQYASVNLLWAPNENFLTGVEALWGRRDDNGGDAGDDYRVQVSVKYSFSSDVLFSKE
jgi:hypothetical protein